MQSDAQKVLDRREEIRARVAPDLRTAGSARCASAFTTICGLNRVLHTGKDFVFIGFDGRPDRTAGRATESSGRRCAMSPACCLSFQYAAQAVFFDQLPGVTRRPETIAALEFWARYWSDWVSAAFLKGYLERELRGASPLICHPRRCRSRVAPGPLSARTGARRSQSRNFATGRTGRVSRSECCCGFWKPRSRST